MAKAGFIRLGMMGAPISSSWWRTCCMWTPVVLFASKAGVDEQLRLLDHPALCRAAKLLSNHGVASA